MGQGPTGGQMKKTQSQKPKFCFQGSAVSHLAGSDLSRIALGHVKRAFLMQLQPQSSWLRFCQSVRDELQMVKTSLTDLLDRKSSAAQIDYAGERLRGLGEGLRGLGMPDASRFAEQAADNLTSGNPRQEVVSRWIFGIECELKRNAQFPYADYAGLRVMWLNCDSAQFADEVCLAARLWGWEVRWLAEDFEPAPGEPILIARDFPGTLTALEQWRPLWPTCPRLCLLAQPSFQDRLALSVAGADLILPASTSLEVVLEQLERLQARARQKGSQVLLVEDDRVTQRVLAKILVQAGYQVEILDNVADFGARLEQVRPEVVILDYQLKDGLGSELCLALRSDPRWSALPVLFLTASRDGETVERLFRAGADDYLAKPVGARDLLGRIHNRLARSRQLRLEGDVDPASGLQGRFQIEQQIQLLLKLAQRQQVSICLALLKLQQGDLLSCAAHLRAGLRRPGDLLGRWNEDTLLLSLYDTSRSQGQQVVERLLNSSPERLSASLGAIPADAGDWVALIGPLQEGLLRAEPGQIVCMGHSRAVQLWSVALVGNPAVFAHWSFGEHPVENFETVDHLWKKLAGNEWSPRVLLDGSLLPAAPGDLLAQLVRSAERLVLVLPDGAEGLALEALEAGVHQVVTRQAEPSQIEASLGL